MDIKATQDRTKKLLDEFLKAKEDTYLILQLKSSEATADERFMNLAWLEKKGKKPEPTHYNAIYGGRLPSGAELEDLYYKFNSQIPLDFTGHSLSVSDVVVLKQSGEVSCYYVDSIGFKKLEDFQLDKI